jgi:hypothetical protein
MPAQLRRYKIIRIYGFLYEDMEILVVFQGHKQTKQIWSSQANIIPIQQT